MKAALAGLPKGLDWISNARFGPGVRDVVEGVEEDAGAAVLLAGPRAHPATGDELGDDAAGGGLVEPEEERQVGLRHGAASVELDERVAVRVREAGRGVLGLEEAELAHELAGGMTEGKDLGEHRPEHAARSLRDATILLHHTTMRCDTRAPCAPAWPVASRPAAMAVQERSWRRFRFIR